MTSGTCQTVCPGSAVATAGGHISTPAVATRQMELLHAIRATWPSGAFNNDRAALETLRDKMGWKTRGAVTVALHALRAKGVLASEGLSTTTPTAWVWKVRMVPGLLYLDCLGVLPRPGRRKRRPRPRWFRRCKVEEVAA